MTPSTSLFALFEKLGIAFETVEHEPVHTASDLARHSATEWEFPVKNIVVYDKMRQHYLVTMHLLTPSLDLKALANKLGAPGRFSFASAEALSRLLGVLPGSVTPFAVMNDTQGHVRLVLDNRLRTANTISAHPLVNGATTTIKVADLLAFLNHTGHRPVWVDLPVKAASGL